MPLDPWTHPRLLCSLAEASEAQPTEKKVLVCSSRVEGLQLLRSLTAAQGGWIGWVPLALADLALEVCKGGLANDGHVLCDSFELEALIDDAFDGVVSAGRAGPLAALAGAAGLRHAVRSLIQELRSAGISPEQIRACDLEDRHRSDAIAEILDCYEKGLCERGLIDPAGIVHRAIAVADGGRDRTPPNIYVVPGISRRGLSGRFLDLLIARGAVILAADPVLGISHPQSVVWNSGDPVSPLSYLHQAGSARDSGAVDVDFFRSAGTGDEVREVLRRVVHECDSFDGVEVLATRPADYTSIFDSFARSESALPISYSTGLGLDRTRIGATVAGYLRWISEGFPSAVIRELLESGVVHPGFGPDGADFESIGGIRLAYRMRELRIGWGRDRYVALVAEALAAPPPKPREDQYPAEVQLKQERRSGELNALRHFFERLFSAAPDPVAGPVAPACIADGLLVLLEFSRNLDKLESTALRIARERLTRISETMQRPMEPGLAISRVRDSLAVSIPTTDAAAGGAWVPVPGHLHVSDFRSGGLSGRRRAFVVGMDADRAGGARTGDPLLGDADRMALAGAARSEVSPLPTTDDLLAEDRFLRAAALARLRGRITLSYPGWDAADGRAVAPAADLLHAYRASTLQPAADYGHMEAAVPSSGAVPRHGRSADSRDVWLAALSVDGSLRDGRAVIEAAYPDLARGVAADVIRRTADDATAHHGLLSGVDPAELDPRLDDTLVLSASALETLGTCPHKYLLRYVLGIKPPDDPVLEPDRWLDALQRGSLLHEVYEKSFVRSREEGVPFDEPRFGEVCQDVLAGVIAATRRKMPVPSEEVFRKEVDALEQDVRCFVGVVQDDPPVWLSVEQAFGLEGNPPASIPVRGGEVLVRGKIDRIDDVGGALRVVDYKTGRAGRYSPRGDPYNGGRRLQHAIYGLVAESLHPDREVRIAEYQFPTVKGEGARSSFQSAVLGDPTAVISDLLDITSSGAFLPTDSGEDCRWCDYLAVCRVRGTDWRTDSPLAAWAAGRISTSDFYAKLYGVRKGTSHVS